MRPALLPPGSCRIERFRTHTAVMRSVSAARHDARPRDSGLRRRCAPRAATRPVPPTPTCRAAGPAGHVAAHARIPSRPRRPTRISRKEQQMHQLPTYDDVSRPPPAHRRARPPHAGADARAPPTRSSGAACSSSARTSSAWAPSSSAAPSTRCRGSTPRSAAPAWSRSPRATTRRRSRSRPGCWASRPRSSCRTTRRPPRWRPRKGYGGRGGAATTATRRTARRSAATLADEHGLTLIPPYDHPDVIAGQGTAAKELFEEVGALDALFVCLGGGGLLVRLGAVGAGAVAGLQGLRRRARGRQRRPAVVAQRRRIVHIETPKTIADGAQTQHLGTLTLRHHPARRRRHPHRHRRGARRGHALLRRRA